MTKFATSQEWLDQSALLLKARPSTTKISTKYKVRKPDASSSKRRRLRPEPTSSDQATASGVLTTKTYDPVSGVVLSYETTKAQEVGRLIGALGRLGRDMAALPEAIEAPATTTLPSVSEALGSGTQALLPEGASKQQGAGGGGGAGKKKKKGKK